MTLEAIRYKDGQLEVLDQLSLPFKNIYEVVHNVSDGWNVIKSMKVRGAPAIAIVGCLSLAVELKKTDFRSVDEIVIFVSEKLEFLISARPTAVNMADAANKLNKLCRELSEDSKQHSAIEIRSRLITNIEQMLGSDIQDNKSIGKHGGDAILKLADNKPVKILTHCNTGSLATAGYGTALGVIRYIHDTGKLEHAYCTETRPYNQGSRLTAYELVYEKMPATLICDSMAAILMQRKEISAVVVGADRVVANGDTANKIGTYQLAIVAKYHGIPFYVAAPTTSIDKKLKSGSDIIIEERSAKEMTSIAGVEVAALGIGVWNPAFDVTPHKLITGGIITEHGVFSPTEI